MVTLLFLLWFKIQQPQNMSQRQLYEVWKRETKEAPKIIKPETVKGLYKVSGRREIVLIADFESHQALDEALSQLPFSKEIGHSVNIEIVALHPYGDYVSYLERALREKLV